MRCATPVIPELAQHEVVLEGEGCIPLPVLISNTPDCLVLSRWTPNDAERQLIATGCDILLTVQSGTRGFPPVRLEVGPHHDTAAAVRSDFCLQEPS